MSFRKGHCQHWILMWDPGQNPQTPSICQLTPSAFFSWAPSYLGRSCPSPELHFRKPWCYFGALKGRGKKGKFSTIFPWRSQKRLTLNMRARLTQKEKCFLKHSVESKSIALSYPGLSTECVSWSPVDDIDQYWSITRTAFPGRAQVNLMPQLLPLPNPLPT